MNQLIFYSMKRIYSFLFVTMAMLMLSVSSAWAQYVKLTAEDGTESWIEIEGTINGENIEIYKGIWESAIDKNTKGSIDLNEVWARSGGRGTHYQVTSIGNGAFYDCSGLTSVVIPSSVTSIGFQTFTYCSGLTFIAIPSSVTSIGGCAFYGCSGLTSVVIPSSVTVIGIYAFTYCSGLTSVVIPSSVTNIGVRAFGGCSGLTSIVVESGNSVYNSRNDCNAIIETTSNTLIFGCKNTKIPSSVTGIGEGAFSESGLTSIVIPSNVTSIGVGAFGGCSGLTSVTSYITDVFKTGTNAFSGCDNATLYVPHDLASTYRSTTDWNRFKNIEEIPGIALAISCNSKGKVTVNGGVQFTNDMGEVSVYDGTDNTFVFTPEENCQLEQVLIDGLDVTLSVKNNQLTTKVHEGSKLIVTFSKSSGDMNGDGMVNISDVVALVNLILGQ